MGQYKGKSERKGVMNEGCKHKATAIQRHDTFSKSCPRLGQLSNKSVMQNDTRQRPTPSLVL